MGSAINLGVRKQGSRIYDCGRCRCRDGSWCGILPARFGKEHEAYRLEYYRGEEEAEQEGQKESEKAG